MRKKGKIGLAVILSVIMSSNVCFATTSGNTILGNELDSSQIGLESVSENEVNEEISISENEIPFEENEEYVEEISFGEENLDNVGNSFFDAMNIGVNTNVTGANSSIGTDNYYQFQITSAGAISIDFSHPLFSSNTKAWDIYLYNSEQKKIYDMNSTDGYTQNKKGASIGLPAGKYYICVVLYAYVGEGVQYNLKVNYTQSNNWETEFNNDWLTADFINANQTYYGVNTTISDEDYFYFNLPSAGVITINFGHPLFSSNTKAWAIYLYNSEQKKIYDMNSTDGYTPNKTSALIGLPAGKYYVCVDLYAYAGEEIQYNLKVNYTQSNNWETEFNDDWLTADFVNVNQTYYGVNTTIGDKDYFYFNLSSSSTVAINFSHPLFSKDVKAWYIYLYDSGQNQIYSMESSNGYSQSATSTPISLSAGKYYVYVYLYSYSGEEMTYSLRVNTQPPIGTTIQSGNAFYKVTKTGASPEMQCIKPSTKSIRTLTVPNTVWLSGFNYKVTSIKSSAFANCKKMTKATLGSNITKIGSKAFSGCSKLKTITVNSKSIKSVGSQAFKGIHKSAKIKVPSSKLSAYKKKFKGKGQKSSVKIVKK